MGYVDVVEVTASSPIFLVALITSGVCKVVVKGKMSFCIGVVLVIGVLRVGEPRVPTFHVFMYGLLVPSASVECMYPDSSQLVLCFFLLSLGLGPWSMGV